MVEPRAARDRLAVQLAGDVELRAAVVVARFFRAASLAAEPGFALQHQLAGEKGEVEVEVARRDARLVARALERQAPVVDPYAGAVGLGVRERESGARRALVVHQPPALRVRERSMREKDLPGIEAARVVALLRRPRAEEGDLEADPAVEPAGDVPPFDAEIGMRAVIAWKRQPVPGNDARIVHFRGPGGERQSGEAEKSAPPHQSSRTARTGPMPIASLPDTMAVSTASATSSNINDRRKA